jgi:hypothetical protein
MRIIAAGAVRALVVLSIVVGSTAIGDDPPQITSVRADEIGTRVQIIIGRLGTPMATIMTVRAYGAAPPMSPRKPDI